MVENIKPTLQNESGVIIARRSPRGANPHAEE
jgi:hypothetical protein